MERARPTPRKLASSPPISPRSSAPTATPLLKRTLEAKAEADRAKTAVDRPSRAHIRAEAALMAFPTLDPGGITFKRSLLERRGFDADPATRIGDSILEAMAQAT